MSRMDRVNEEVRHQVSTILQRDVQDPRIGFVTITRVDVSSDLRQAKIFFTTIEQGKSYEDTLSGLKRSTGFIRKMLGQRIRMKFTPDIQFVYDKTDDKKSRVEEILDMIHREKEGLNGDQ